MGTTKTIGLCRVGRVYEHGRTRLATNQEVGLGLALKLFEEVGEVTRAPRDVEEYADVLQALQDYAISNNVDWADDLVARDRKERMSGGFLPGLLWEKK